MLGAEGGAIALVGSNAIIENNTIYGNYAQTRAGGISGRGSSNPIIKNNILWNDSSSAISFANEIYFYAGCTPLITYCDIQDTLCPGPGNMSVPPLFRDTINGDFHLKSTSCGDIYDSPCIDAGDPYILDSLLDCSWGLGGLRSDMGAYGGGDSAVVGIVNTPPIPGKFILMQNYPNPFNAQTTIRFLLPESQNARLTVYDILGRWVQMLIDGYLQAGSHSINFDASGLSSGVYFYRLQGGDKVDTRRMVLLK